MDIEIRIDETRTQPKVLILTDRITPDVTALMERLSHESPQVIAGFANENAVLLEQAALIHLYAEDGRVCAVTSDGVYHVRLRLYELEERLDKKSFVRISHSEIINLKAVRRFDLSLTGTICVALKNGDITYVSRRYVSKIRQVLGL